MSYEDAAPNVSQLRTEEEFKTDFPPPPPPRPPLGDPDAAAKAALYQAFRVEYNANGGAVDLGRLARSQGVPIRWCRILRDEINAAKAAVYGE
jgi:hypothetical protein